MPNFIMYLVTKIFAKAFDLNKDSVSDVKDDLANLIKALLRLGGNEIREFIAAVPIFMKFVAQLVERRSEFKNGSPLMLVGAGAVLGSVPVILTVSLLSSLPIQLSIFLANPFLGLALIFSTQAVIFSVVVLVVWVIIFVLNKAFANDPLYQQIRDEFLSPQQCSVLDRVAEQVSGQGESLEKVASMVEQSLKAQGEAGSAKEVGERLSRAKGKLEAQIERAKKRAASKEGTEPRKDIAERKLQRSIEKARSALERYPVSVASAEEDGSAKDEEPATRAAALKAKMLENSKVGRAKALDKLAQRGP